MSEQNKQQHYIPSSYLNAWCDINTPPHHKPYVWLFDKNEKTGKNKSPENIFLENNMYTIFKNGERDLFIEHGFRDIETKFKWIRDKLVNFDSLEIHEHEILCAFVASMCWRTRNQLDYISEVWTPPLKYLEAMEKWKFKEKYNITPLISMNSVVANFTVKEVRDMVENPAQHVMPLVIKDLFPKLKLLDIAVFHTDDPIGFITSDNPCVWYDPNSDEPLLISDTIELSMPISPNRIVIFNKMGLTGYFKINPAALDTINQRTRTYALSKFVVNQNQVKDVWFGPLAVD